MRPSQQSGFSDQHRARMLVWGWVASATSAATASPHAGEHALIQRSIGSADAHPGDGQEPGGDHGDCGQ